MPSYSAGHTVKYAFKIRTRDGLLVERVVIHGRDEADAERKLRQMYRHCEIVECAALDAAPKLSSATFEEIISLVSK